MTEVIAVGLYGAEGNAAEAMDFENQLILLFLSLGLRLLLLVGGRLGFTVGVGREGVRRENDVDV